MSRGESGELSKDAQGRVRWGRRAAGLLIQREDTEEFLLLLRSQDVMDPGLWGIPGGRVEPGESDQKAAFAEAKEELGTLPPVQVLHRRAAVSGGFTYVTFHVMMSAKDAERFQPTLNWESDDWGWFALEALPTDTHPGVLSVLERQ